MNIGLLIMPKEQETALRSLSETEKKRFKQV